MHPDAQLSIDELRSRLLRPSLYGLTAFTGLGTVGTTLRVLLEPGTPGFLPFVLGGCFVGLLVALAMERASREREAARLGLTVWLIEIASHTILTGATAAGDWELMLVMEPAMLASIVGLATIFDADAIRRWTSAAAAVHVAAFGALAILAPERFEDPGSGLFISVLPAALIVILGWSVVQYRDFTVSRAGELERSIDRQLRALDGARADAEAARRASRAKSDFLTRMSHELRTPLNAVIGYTEMVAEELAEEERGDLEADLQRSLVAARHLLQILGDILDLSKLEAGQIEIRTARFELSELIDEVALVCEPIAVAHGNRLVVGTSGAVHATADRLRIGQVLTNLVGNACKFTENGEIRLTAAVTDSELRFEVSDDGIGMGDEALGHVFEPFFQVDDAPTRRRGGLGLGLPIVRALVELQGGTLRVDSEAGRGTTFTVRIPLRPVWDDEVHPDQGRSEGSAGSGGATPGNRVVPTAS